MEQKQLLLEVAQDMLDSANSNSEFLNIVTTGDESWVYGYDPETKAQSSFSLKITMRRSLSTLSLTRWLHATDAVCWREKIHVCA
jgi:hypothetical protein